ncbi:hypothetical protein ACTVCO_05650 [Sanguibacter sp. A247]|uniref:hypothetical protein n=1 Tax=unclassified Sanguibacter TaxID=2645534 RepID=UPI003FD6CAAC
MASTGAFAGPGGSRPLSYWLGLVGGLAEDAVNRVYDDAGLDRRHWQVLAVVRDGASSPAQVDASLGAPGQGTTLGLLDDLRSRGWVTGPAHLEDAPADVGGLAVTVTGEEAYAALQRDLAEERDRMTRGLAARDHEVTVLTLQQLARNLGWQGEP